MDDLYRSPRASLSRHSQKRRGLAVRFSPQPNGHCNRAESCDYKKEDAPYAADSYERFYSLKVHVDAPPGATSTCELARIQRGLYYPLHAPST